MSNPFEVSSVCTVTAPDSSHVGLRQVGVLSVRLVDGALGATMGVISCVFMSVVSLVGTSMAGGMGTTEMMMGPDISHHCPADVRCDRFHCGTAQRTGLQHCRRNDGWSGIPVRSTYVRPRD